VRPRAQPVKRRRSPPHHPQAAPMPTHA
jgi:hypothetical protein